jgi:putative FmdB family regulatory protein
MPLYEYQCESCGHRFEVIQKFSDNLVSVCPNCGKGPVVKLLSSPAIQFKGSGFYITDYARKESGKSSETGSGSSSSSSDTGKSSGSAASDSSASTATPAKTDTSTKSGSKSDT